MELRKFLILKKFNNKKEKEKSTLKMVAMYYNLGMHKPHSSHGTMKILSSK
jgi:hypothetical protein